ncbi:putative FDF domain-containing protein [Medicago truncatula]|nr:protein decapping 5-like [Medicago truncatula]RHN54555.1 putative FDF domain-containing protein [Medicago truncatula]
MPYSVSVTTDASNTPSFCSPLQDINSVEGRITGKIRPYPSPISPQYSVHNRGSSIVDSTLGPFLTPQSLLTSDRFAHPREWLLAQNLNPNWKDMGSLPLTSSVPMPSPAFQSPLEHLPTSVHKAQYPSPQFTEEFDFVAMNEKFKKDEVWNSIAKATTKIEGLEDIEFLNLGERECHKLKSAYKKDDFFDTISSNSMTRGSRNRLSARTKQDTERFGNFHQRPNAGYGDYGAGRGENFRGYLGRGYGYGGRGHGPNFPF